MRIGLLGPLQVRDGADTLMIVNGVLPRLLLMRLSLEPGRPIATTVLIDALWPQNPPDNAAAALREVITQLRRSLRAEDAARIQVVPNGYRLNIPANHIDIGEFEEILARMRTADPDEAEALLERAQALWRGEPFATAPNAPFAAASIARLHRLRQRTAEHRAATAQPVEDGQLTR